MIRIESIKAVFEKSLKLKKEESCLIITDTVKEDIGRAFFEYAKKICRKAEIKVIAPTKEHASEPPQNIAEEMLKYDVEILATEKSLTHTLARRNATARGARIATMPMITEEIANRCLDIDYDELKRRSQLIYTILKDSKEIRVLSSKGTDVKFSVGGTKFFGENGGSFDFRGAYGNLPEGEVSFSPGKAEGRYVVDASFPEIGKLTDILSFEVKGGYVSEITGARSIEVKERLNSVGEKAYKVAELGIGLNPKAIITGNILEDEKVIGTVHIAVGNNLSYGGTNDVPLHLDGVINNATVIVDGKKLLDEGKFLIEGW